MPGRANVAPKDLAALVLEHHAQVIKIPKDQPQRMKEGVTNDHVVAINRVGVAIDVEDLIHDANADVVG